MPAVEAPFLLACRREAVPHTPLWLMRQAGRFLPEYRAIRSRMSFLELCKNPDAAAEVTLQPLRRFPYDAAIVFADILLIPGALGQKVWFEAGEGPRLGALPDIQSMRALAPAAGQALSQVGETLGLVRAALEEDGERRERCKTEREDVQTGQDWNVDTDWAHGEVVKFAEERVQGKPDG